MQKNPQLLALLILASLPRALGTETGIPITAHDAHGHAQTIWIGVHPKATYGFDKELGEMPIPPVPPIPVLDVRLEDPQGKKQYRFDGTWVDIRPFTSVTQTDTFFVRYQAADDAFPVVLSWDSTAFSGFKTARILGNLTSGAVSHSLKQSSRLTIPNGEFTTFRIILIGPPPPSPDK